MAIVEERTEPAGTEGDLPMIVSVDDHVVEPAHVWERWLPAEVPGPTVPASSGGASAP